VILAWSLYTQGIEYAAIKGVVEKREESVAPVETARLTEVAVKAGQPVVKGQILAQLDTTVIDAEMSLERAQHREASETISGFIHDILRANSQFNEAIASGEAALATEQRNLTEAAAELGVLSTELIRLQKLVDGRVISESALTPMKARAAALKEGVKLYPRTILALETRLADARTERKTLLRRLGMSENEDYEKAIDEKLRKREEIHGEQMKLLRARLETYTLHASRNGIVARVFRQKGDIVGPQTPVLAIVESGTTDIVAFLPEGRARECSTNMTVHVASPVDRKLFECKVVAIAPDIVWLPLRVSPTQNQGQGARGRRVTLRLVETANLLPGETVDVFFAPSRDGIGTRLNRMLKGKKTPPAKKDKSKRGTRTS
jgi:multidrug resistance efflux pump